MIHHVRIAFLTGLLNTVLSNINIVESNIPSVEKDQRYLEKRFCSIDEIKRVNVGIYYTQETKSNVRKIMMT